MRAEDVYERIKRDISEFPVFRFDWFFKSRSTQELQRRCNTLLGMIEKEAEALAQQEGKSKGRGKVGILFPFSFGVTHAFVETGVGGRTKGRRDQGIKIAHACCPCAEKVAQEEEDIGTGVSDVGVVRHAHNVIGYAFPSLLLHPPRIYICHW